MGRPKEAARIAGPADEDQRIAEEAAEVLFDLLLAQKRVSQGVAKEFGLTLQQLAALRNLGGPEGMPMSALADALACDAANVTAVVDKLEARGLVRRSGSRDRRVRLLETTARGADLRQKMLARLRCPTPWITALDPEERRLLRDLLRKGLERAQAAAETVV
ncbi:MAG TPA: MarR family transcriptional regulator [Thermoanaerobaculia bacterium]|nr:MarR family transcriptional regulator [Thermoanaerobaculia bacterium]